MKLKLTIIFVILMGCSSVDKKWEMITGSWSVVSISEEPLTISNYGDGRLAMSSTVNFRADSVLEIFLSDSTVLPETFHYEIENNELVILYSDYGIPFQIESITKDRLKLRAEGYGNTEDLRRKIREITLAKSK